MKKKKDYETLVEAMKDLKDRGYTEDFNLKRDCIECQTRKMDIEINDFEVDEMYRFEGMTNPSDSSILYAISSPKNDLKGVMVDAYGVYADPVNSEMLEKLRYVP